MARQAESANEPEPDPPSGDDGVSGRLGLPESGPGALAGWVRRIGALAVDWIASNLVAYAILRDGAAWQQPSTALDFVPLLVFAVEVWLLTALLGASVGHRLFGIGVRRLDGRQPVGFGRALARTALILLLLPVLFIDRDGRGAHDRLAGTVLIRTRP